MLLQGIYTNYHVLPMRRPTGCLHNRSPSWPGKIGKRVMWWWLVTPCELTQKHFQNDTHIIYFQKRQPWWCHQMPLSHVLCESTHKLLQNDAHIKLDLCNSGNVDLLNGSQPHKLVQHDAWYMWMPAHALGWHDEWHMSMAAMSSSMMQCAVGSCIGIPWYKEILTVCCLQPQSLLDWLCLDNSCELQHPCSHFWK